LACLVSNWSGAHIGKESNRLEDARTGLIEDLNEVVSEYDDYYQRVFVPLVLPVLNDLGVRETARRTGHSLGAVSATLSRRSRPRPTQTQGYVRVAVTCARVASAAREESLAADDAGVLRRYRERNATSTTVHADGLGGATKVNREVQ
jgi:hypothetical protein